MTTASRKAWKATVLAVAGLWATGFGRAGSDGEGGAFAAPLPWQKAAIWNDGKAEVNSYKATEIKYGVPRDFMAYFIVVAEDLRGDTLVKTDEASRVSKEGLAAAQGGTVDRAAISVSGTSAMTTVSGNAKSGSPKANARAGLVRVLKMNQVYEIPTGIYTYQQMASVFLRTSDFTPVKESVTSHEWCGNSFALLHVREGRGTLRSFTYFDGEAEATQTVDLAGATLYDALPLTMRAVPFGSGLERRLRIASQLLDNRLVTMKVSDALLSVEGLETIATAMGPIETWRVDIKSPAGTDQFWIERDAPNRLVQWFQADGGKYLLQSSKRLAYWTMHDPADAKALEPPNAGADAGR